MQVSLLEQAEKEGQVSKTLLSISYYAGHAKGGDGIGYLDGEMHAEWLEQAVDFYRSQLPEVPVIIACTGFSGILNIYAGRERDALWRIMGKAQIVGVSQNPGHQVGAALCIRLGLEMAGKLGYDNLIHTAEDVVPQRGVLRRFIQALDEGHDYAGEVWGHPRDERNAQFFAVRTQALCPEWDACAVTGAGCIERYLEVLLRGKPQWLGKECLYRTTHNFEEWKMWKREVSE